MEETRLTRSRLADNADHLSAARLRPREETLQQLQLVLPANERNRWVLLGLAVQPAMADEMEGGSRVAGRHGDPLEIEVVSEEYRAD